eukprot:scaffold418338_cov19-Prasinocladus_malaysianus.AAC.1
MVVISSIAIRCYTYRQHTILFTKSPTGLRRLRDTTPIVLHGQLQAASPVRIITHSRHITAASACRQIDER